MNQVDDVNKQTVTHMLPLIAGLPLDMKIITSPPSEEVQPSYQIKTLTAYQFIYPIYTNIYHTDYSPMDVLRGFSIIPSIGRNMVEFLNERKRPIELRDDIISLIPPSSSTMSSVSVEQKACASLSKEIVHPDVYAAYPYLLLPVTSHPVEYSTFTLRQILNAFLILIHLVCLFTYSRKPNNITALSIIGIYAMILIKEFKVEELYKVIKKNKNSSYEIIKKLINHQIVEKLDAAYDTAEQSGVLDKIYGTIITPSILEDALCGQSYFIRKCYETSYIHTYTPILKTLEIITSYPIVSAPPIISDANASVPLKTLHEFINSPEFQGKKRVRRTKQRKSYRRRISKKIHKR